MYVLHQLKYSSLTLCLYFQRSSQS